jgi:uncharacterized protein (DUF433 family)
MLSVKRSTRLSAALEKTPLREGLDKFGSDDLFGSGRLVLWYLAQCSRNTPRYTAKHDKMLAGVAAMDDDVLLGRITQDAGVLNGKPIIAGTRLSVEYIVNLLAHGASTQEILSEYSGLTQDDIRACLLYAARSLSGAA